MSDDHLADTSTGGTVAVGGSATGNIEVGNDFDWFAVEFIAGRTYVIDVEGEDTGGGTLADPVLRGLYLDDSGNRIADTQNNDGGDDRNARITFVATTTATHYIAARGRGLTSTGTYTVRVTDATTQLSNDDDYTQAVEGAGTVAVDGSVTGNIETVDDRDWFAVELVADKAYRIKLEGSATDEGTLEDPYLRGIYEIDVDQNANLIAGTDNNDDGQATNSEFVYQASASGTFYIAAGANGSSTGTYKLSVDELADDYVAGTGTTGVVTVGGSATGNIEIGDDFDWFAVEFIAGRTYVIDVEGEDTGGGTLADPVLRGLYLDDSGNRIADTQNNDGGDDRNARITFVATTTATHYIAARGRGLTSTGTYTVRVTDATTQLSNDDDYTQAVEGAGTVAVDGSVTGNIETVDDRDWFAVELVADKAYRIKLEGSATDEGTLEDPYLRGIYDIDVDQNANLIAGTDNNDGGQATNSEFVYQATASGTFYIAAGANGSTTGTYKLSVDELADDYAAGTGTTGVVTVGGNATGDVQFAHDRDWFAVELVAGTRYRIRLEGSQTDRGTLSDPYLRGIYDGSGDRISSTGNNDGGQGRNSELFYEAAATGTHYIAAGGNDNSEGTYRLSVAEAPVVATTDDFGAGTDTTGTVTVGGNVAGDVQFTGDRDWFGVEFEAGRAYLIQLEGRQKDLGTLRDPYLFGIYDQSGDRIPNTSDNDNGAGLDSRLIYLATETGTHYIAAGSDRASSLHGPPHGTYQLSVTLIPDEFSADTETTGAVTADGDYVRGVLEYSADIDWFAVQLEAGTRYRVDVKGGGVDYGGTLPNPVLVVYDSSGDALVSDDDTGRGRNARLTGFVPETDGTYYIGVNGRGGVGSYRVFVTTVPVDPDDDFTQSATGSGTVEVDGSVTGDIEVEYDHDWFAVTLEADKTYRIKLEGSPTNRGTLSDPYLWGIYTGGEEQNDNLIANTSDDDSGAGRNSEVLYRAATSGTYYISAGAHENGYRPVKGTYRLSVDEVEDDFLATTGTTGTVTVDSNTTGNIQFANDRDWFAVEFEAGHAYRIKLEGSPTSQGTLSDPYLRGIYDQNGDRIANTTDDDSGVGNNSQLVYVAAATGTHYIAAGGYVSGDWASKGTYRLYVTNIVDDFGSDTDTTGTVAVDGSVTGEVQHPREHDWFAVELEADTPYVIRVEGREARQGTLFDPYLHGIYDENGDLIPDTSDDDGGDGTTSELLFETPTAGTYYISAGGNHSWLGTYRMSVTTFDDDFDADTDTTGVVTVGGNVTGDIQLISDVDWFAVDFVAGTRYRIRMEGSSTDDGTLFDPYLRGIYDQNGDLIPDTSDDDSGVGRNSELNYVAAESGTHYIAAADYGGSMGTYELSVRAYTDDFGADTNTTGAVTVGGSTTGRLNHDGDRDWFAVTLEAAKTYRIDVKGDTTGDSGGTLHNPALVMHDSSGDAIDQAADDNSGVGLNARMAAFSPDTDGTYYIEVNDPGGLGTYTVAVQEAEDSI